MVEYAVGKLTTFTSIIHNIIWYNDVHCTVRSHIIIIYVIYILLQLILRTRKPRDDDIEERSFPPLPLRNRDRSTGHYSFTLSDNRVVVVIWKRGGGDNRWPRGGMLIRQCSITGARYARLTFRDPVGKLNSIIILFWTAHNWFSVRQLRFHFVENIAVNTAAVINRAYNRVCICSAYSAEISNALIIIMIGNFPS